MIDLDAIERVGVNKNAAELAERIKEVETKQQHELRSYQARLKEPLTRTFHPKP